MNTIKINNKVVVVNHGNVFNTGNWYTFYCPYCERQITRQDSNKECSYCKQEIQWE